MKKDQNRSDKRSQAGSSEQDAAPAAARGLEGAIGGALSRVFERAGLDVRVVPAGSPAPSAPPPEASRGAAPPAAPVPAPAPAASSVQDALVTLAVLAIGRQLLAKAQPAVEAPRPPAVQCDRLSELLSSDPADAEAPAPQPVAPVAGRVVVAGGPARPSTGRTAEPRPSTRPAPSPRRSVTIRY